jgi:hypothetical protein
MKKGLFPVLALVLVLCLSLASPLGLALAQENDPYVCLDHTGPGDQLLLDPYGVRWARLFYMEVDGVIHEGWCIEPDVPLNPGQCFNATLYSMPRETPWCEIGYIMANYSSSSGDNETAATQLAIWKCIEGRLAVTATAPANIETRALEIYDDAQGKCLTGSQWVVRIHPTVAGAEIQETVILLSAAVGGDVRPVDKLAVLAPWIGLAVLLIVGGMVWFRLRRRSA